MKVVWEHRNQDYRKVEERETVRSVDFRNQRKYTSRRNRYVQACICSRRSGSSCRNQVEDAKMGGNHNSHTNKAFRYSLLLHDFPASSAIMKNEYVTNDCGQI